MSMSPIWTATCRRMIEGLIIGLVLPAAASALAGGDIIPPEAATGAWDFHQTEGSRQCRVTLRLDAAQQNAHVVGMPAGCRHALPVLGHVGSWSVTPERRLTLADKSGQVVLTFSPDPDATFHAQGADGQTYAFEQVDGPRLIEARAGPQPPAPISAIRPGATPGLRRVAAATAAPAATSQPPAVESPVVPFPGRVGDIAGRYAILRDSDKDVGCLLTLDDRARGPAGTSKAQLAPACRDQGIVVFDPVGWQVIRGRLVLTARKGHNASFDWHADGVWRKDPKEGGKPLGLKKIQPISTSALF